MFQNESRYMRNVSECSRDQPYLPPSNMFRRLESRTILIQRKSLSKIDPPNLHIVTQFPRSTGPEDFTLRNNVCAIRHAQSLPHIVVGNQNPDPTCLQVKDNPLQIQNPTRVHA